MERSERRIIDRLKSEITRALDTLPDNADLEALKRIMDNWPEDSKQKLYALIEVLLDEYEQIRAKKT